MAAFCATFFARAFLAELFATDLGTTFCVVFAGTIFFAEANFFAGAALLIEEAVWLPAFFCRGGTAPFCRRRLLGYSFLAVRVFIGLQFDVLIFVFELCSEMA